MALSAQHNRRAEKRLRVEHRRPSSQRGYDRRWYRLARMHRAKHPLCVECLRLGVVNASGSQGKEHPVDHIIPFHGVDDPLRLDATNLQTLCHTHHQQKTARDRRVYQ